MKEKYTFKEVVKASKDYFNGDTLAAEVFTNKYALKDEEGNYLESTPADMHKRLAKEFARIEKKYPNPMSEKEIFDLFDKYRYVCPQGSPMFGIGNPNQKVSLSNCFVIDVVDSYGGICRADERIAQIAKRRGGVGLDISPIRPKGLPTKNSALTTDGIVVFMERFSNTSREVAQCIDKDQRVLTKSGLKRIEDVIPNLDYVWTKVGWVKVLGKIKNEKQVYKVTSEAGYEIKTSIDHIFMTYDGKQLIEKKLSEIEEGDTIVLLCGNENIRKDYVKLLQYQYDNINNKPNNCVLPEILDEDLAYLIGYSYGDGHVSRNKYNEPSMIGLACAHKYPEIQSKLEKIVIDKFSYHPAIKYCKGEAVNSLQIYNKCLVDFLDKNKLLKEKSQYIVFPSNIINSPVSVISAFISGYFDADDYASGKKKGYSFASINVDFLKCLQSILLSIGVFSKIHFEDRSHLGWNTLYTLSVAGGYSKKIFKRLMSFSYKVSSSTHEGKRDNWLTPYISGNFGVSHNKYNFIPDNSQNISVMAYDRLSNKIKLPEGILIQDKVASIEEDIITDTYDLQLESEHLFWCEGFYVHNSGRRGALMLSISVHHPEVLNFIKAKRDLKKVTGANISVRITDEFMKAVQKKETYEQRWPVDSNKPIIKQEVKAKEIWDELVKSNWMSGEPGILFWDTIIKNSPADSYSDEGMSTTCTNPCGELPLAPGSSCILLLQNLVSYVKNPFTKDAQLDEELLKVNSMKAQRLIDDMVDLEIEAIDKIISKIESDPESEEIKYNEINLWKYIKDTCSKSRRTGLGVTGLGDCLAMLNIKYGSKESFKTIEKIFSIIRNEAYRSSVKMAKERGAFPVWDNKKEKNNKFLNRLPDDILSEMAKHGRRNISCLTIPPAGSVSTQTQTTSGFEPVFMAEYIRKRKLTDNDKDVPDFIDQMGDKWKNYKVEHKGLQLFKSINTGKELVDSPYNGSQASDIDYEARVKLQGLATSFIDHAISSTINLPSDIDIKTVDKLYMLAWQHGCKGLTIYRDGCRDGVLTKQASVNTRECEECEDASQKLTKQSEEGYRPPHLTVASAPKRPQMLECDIHRSKVGGGEWLFVVGILNGQPYEIFGGQSEEFTIPHKYRKGWIKKNGKVNGITQYNLILGALDDENEKLEFKGIAKNFNNYEYGAFTRLASLTIRHGVPIKYICEQITKKGVEGDLFSFQRAMARILKKYIHEGEASGVECPDCGSTDMVYKNGCPACMVCGYSQCA